MKINRQTLKAPLLFFALLASSAVAEVHLPHVLSSNGVLQRDGPIHIWGWSDPDETIDVNFHAQHLSTKADADGNWELWLHPEAAGGPYTLSVSGETGAPVVLNNMLVGDVWIASGQSNMTFPLKGFQGAPLKDSSAEIAKANHPRIRLLLEHTRISDVPLGDQENEWKECTSETAANFSAVAYFFGREISDKENVPIGLIESSWSGKPAHSFISLDGIARAELPSVAQDAAQIAADQGRADALKDRYSHFDDELRAAGKPVPKRRAIPGDHAGAFAPASIYNGMIAPLTPYTIKGVIWYQGEQDSSPERAAYYQRVFPALLTDWHRQWHEGNFPFLWVQLASFQTDPQSDFALVRDAQRRTLSLRNTDMAVAIDVGQRDNIHPPDKQTVGHRLALAAREDVYGEPIAGRSPEFVQTTTEGRSMRVWLRNTKTLSLTGDGTGFELAGKDQIFKPATVKIEGNTLLISSPTVAAPKYVRYGWSGWVSGYVDNEAGLPLSTFTSQP